MDFEKKLVIAAPPAQVWELLLDPQVMGACVPGMQSIEVLSDVEYLAHIQVKIAFVSARFRIRTTVVEQRPPHYLRCEGVGEDASVASSLKQASEMFLVACDDGQTELCMKIKVDVFGRLGTFGLNVMKTKADRMWDEFGAQLAARVAAPPAPAAEAVTPEPDAPAPVATLDTAAPAQAPQALASPLPPVMGTGGGRASWWSRVFAPPAAQPGAARLATDIRIEVRRGSDAVTVLWPVQGAGDCAAWLRDYLK